MPRLLASAFALLLCLPAAAGEFRVLNRPMQADPVYVIPPGICGNGVVEDGEECDPGYPDLGVEPDMGGVTCETQGFNGGGEVACTSKCTVDARACHCDVGAKFLATGQTSSFHSGDDGGIRAGAPLSYTDHGDGTVTDNNTLLMWEKKTDAGGIHDKDDRYGWAASFTEFIDALNNTCEGDGRVVCDNDDICGAGGRCGFAGYRDWRMPNRRELASIVNLGRSRPSVDRAFDTDCVQGCRECSCTVSSYYWSSSSFGGNAFRAWHVNFYPGYVSSGSKDSHLHVRAVRGGLD